MAGDQPRAPRPGGEYNAIGRSQQQQAEGSQQPGHSRELLEHLDGPVEAAHIHDDAGQPADAEGSAWALIPDSPQDRYETDPFEIELVKTGVAQKYENAAEYCKNPGQCCFDGVVGWHGLSLVFIAVTAVDFTEMIFRCDDVYVHQQSDLFNTWLYGNKIRH